MLEEALFWFSSEVNFLTYVDVFYDFANLVRFLAFPIARVSVPILTRDGHTYIEFSISCYANPECDEK